MLPPEDRVRDPHSLSHCRSWRETARGAAPAAAAFSPPLLTPNAPRSSAAARVPAPRLAFTDKPRSSPTLSRRLQPAPTTEEEVFQCIFDYIDRLFAMVAAKLLYMAIDGVAPREDEPAALASFPCRAGGARKSGGGGKAPREAP